MIESLAKVLGGEEEGTNGSKRDRARLRRRGLPEEERGNPHR
jgi:hypothetical protein